MFGYEFHGSCGQTFYCEILLYSAQCTGYDEIANDKPLHVLTAYIFLYSIYRCQFVRTKGVSLCAIGIEMEIYYNMHDNVSCTFDEVAEHVLSTH